MKWQEYDAVRVTYENGYSRNGYILMDRRNGEPVVHLEVCSGKLHKSWRISQVERVGGVVELITRDPELVSHLRRLDSQIKKLRGQRMAVLRDAAVADSVKFDVGDYR